MKNKARLTITVEKNVLRLVDKEIGVNNLSNRSQVIEYYLKQSLEYRPPKALILVGGKQIKFPGLTSGDLPKAMLPVNGAPLLEGTIRLMASFGIKEIIISVGTAGQKIKDYFRNGQKLGVRIDYIEQSASVRGTAQALKEAKSFFSDKTFLMVYGDVYTDINYFDLIEFHKLHKNNFATMMLTSVDNVKSWGVAKLAGSRVIEFKEKPKLGVIKSHLVNAGVYVLEPNVFDYIKAADIKLETSAFMQLAEEGRLGGYVYEGNWLDVSSEESYRELLSRVRK